jgi:hypothetical protein
MKRDAPGVNREPTLATRKETAEAERYEYRGVSYDRIQPLTIKGILEGKREFHTPARHRDKDHHAAAEPRANWRSSGQRK